MRKLDFGLAPGWRKRKQGSGGEQGGRTAFDQTMTAPSRLS
jgi:hypothetical protein